MGEVKMLARILARKIRNPCYVFPLKLVYTGHTLPHIILRTWTWVKKKGVCYPLHNWKKSPTLNPSSMHQKKMSQFLRGYKCCRIPTLQKSSRATATQARGPPSFAGTTTSTAAAATVLVPQYYTYVKLSTPQHTKKSLINRFQYRPTDWPKTLWP